MRDDLEKMVAELREEIVELRGEQHLQAMLNIHLLARLALMTEKPKDFAEQVLGNTAHDLQKSLELLAPDQKGAAAQFESALDRLSRLAPQIVEMIANASSQG